MKTISSFEFKTLQQIGILKFKPSLRPTTFGLQEAKALMQILDEVEQSKLPHVGLLLHSEAAQVFCAGGNLKDYAQVQDDPQRGHQINAEIRTVLTRLARLQIPTVVAVSGDCYGGGVELLSAFDYVVATPQAFFALWQRRVGLSFGWGGAERLAQRMAVQDIRRLALATNAVDAYTALQMGLVDAIVPDYKLFEHATNWLLNSGHLPQLPVAGIKAWPHENETRLFERLWLNPEHKQALQKYLK